MAQIKYKLLAHTHTNGRQKTRMQVLWNQPRMPFRRPVQVPSHTLTISFGCCFQRPVQIPSHTLTFTLCSKLLNWSRNSSRNNAFLGKGFHNSRSTLFNKGCSPWVGKENLLVLGFSWMLHRRRVRCSSWQQGKGH